MSVVMINLEKTYEVLKYLCNMIEKSRKTLDPHTILLSLIEMSHYVVLWNMPIVDLQECRGRTARKSDLI